MRQPSPPSSTGPPPIETFLAQTALTLEPESLRGQTLTRQPL